MQTEIYSFVAVIEFLRIDRPLGSRWKVAADVNIGTSESTARQLVNPNFEIQAGTIETENIVSGKPFFYAITEFPLKDKSPDAQMRLLNARLRLAVMFCNSLWFVKDNSVNVDRGFLRYPFNSYVNQQGGYQTSLNSWMTRFSTAKGELTRMEFSTLELRKAIEMHKELYGEIPKNDDSEGVTPGTAGRSSRLSRALYFLQGARASNDLPGKIANYCTSFETLVSTNSTELAHQVAERVAVLIGNDPSDSLDIYRNLKRAYATRSKLVHGDNLTANNQRYMNESMLCDDYLRRLLTIVISDTEVNQGIEQKSQDVDAFFLEKLFDAGQR